MAIEGRGRQHHISQYSSGYPKKVEVSTLSNGPLFGARISPQNAYYCNGEWENCYTFPPTRASRPPSRLSPRRSFRSARFAPTKTAGSSSTPRTIQFTAYDLRLRAFLHHIAFTPKFWVTAKTNQHNYLVP